MGEGKPRLGLASNSKEKRRGDASGSRESTRATTPTRDSFWITTYPADCCGALVGAFRHSGPSQGPPAVWRRAGPAACLPAPSGVAFCCSDCPASPASSWAGCASQSPQVARADCPLSAQATITHAAGRWPTRRFIKSSLRPEPEGRNLHEPAGPAGHYASAQAHPRAGFHPWLPC